MPPELGLTAGISCSLEWRSKRMLTFDAGLSSNTSPICPLIIPKLASKHQLARYSQELSVGEKGKGEEKDQGGSMAELPWCVGRVNIWPPADVHLMGTWELAELGHLHGKSSSKVQACTAAFPSEGAWFAPLFSSRARIFIKQLGVSYL